MDNIIQDIAYIARLGIHFRKLQLEPLGISSRHATYLLRICDAPGITQEQLTRQILVDKSNVARQVAGLEEAGFLERRPSPEDRRSVCLFPTEKALALMPRIRQVYTLWENTLSQALTPEELGQLSALLQRLKDRAEKELEAAEHG